MQLLDKIKSWFRPEILLVEPPPVSPIVESPEALHSLGAHPGMLMLLNRFKRDRLILEAKLRATKFQDLREVYSLQSGLYWLDYVEDTIRRAANAKVSARSVPDEDLRQSFNTILNQIEAA